MGEAARAQALSSAGMEIKSQTAVAANEASAVQAA
jgi:hypothetical protein